MADYGKGFIVNIKELETHAPHWEHRLSMRVRLRQKWGQV